LVNRADNEGDRRRQLKLVGWRFVIEEMELRVGMGVAWSGEATCAFFSGREEGSGQGGGRSGGGGARH
jgi:hypothetical protein